MTQQVIALATSVFTFLGLWLVGSKRTIGWTVNLGNQALWFVFIVAFGAWGLLPLNIALVVVNARALVKWRKETT